MILPKRIWKDIEGYDGFYQVSNLGEIRSKRCVLKLSPNKGGYIVKRLRNKTYYIHRLVAEIFIPNPNNLPEVNHKDENKTNNCVWNLEWCTHQYNNNYGTKSTRHSNYMKNNPSIRGEGSHFYGVRLYGDSNPNSKCILCVELNKVFTTVNEAANYMNGSQSNISNCLRGYSKTAYGYTWKYIEGDD